MAKFILLIICCTAKFCSGQQVFIDSLENALLNYPKEDTVRWQLMNNLSFEYQFSNAEKGLIVAERALDLAQKLENEKAIAGSYSLKGLNYNAKGQDSVALEMYKVALALHKHAGNGLGVARTYNNMAIVYVERSEYNRALECHKKAFSYLEKVKDTVRMAASLSNQGVVYLYLADYPKALALYLKALTFYDKIKNENEIGNALTNVGIVYKNLGNFSRSLEYHAQALRAYGQTGNLRGKAKALGNMGVSYDASDNSSKALECYQQALLIDEGIGNKLGVGSNLANIGAAYVSLENYPLALHFLMKAVEVYKETNDKNGLSSTLNQLGNVILKVPDKELLQRGILPGERFRIAITHQQQALAMAASIGALDRQAESWEQLSHTYEQAGNYQQALNAFKKYMVLQDSVLNDEKRQAIFRTQVQYEQDKKEAILRAENSAVLGHERTIRKFLIAGAVIILISSISLFIFYKKRRDAEQKKNAAEAKVHQVDTEMKILRLQMNPHFIFNSLNSIGDFILKNNTKEADAYLSKFAKVMRTILENSEKTTITLSEELYNLELYMQLEAHRLDQKFTYTITVDDTIDPENIMVPPLILQPFIENSIWHGIAKKESEGQICISVTKHSEMISIRIEDNGAGMSNSLKGVNKEHRKSLGLKITKARIDMLNRLNGTNATVELVDKPGGVIAELKMPVELNF